MAKCRRLGYAHVSRTICSEEGREEEDERPLTNEGVYDGKKMIVLQASTAFHGLYKLGNTKYFYSLLTSL